MIEVMPCKKLTVVRKLGWLKAMTVISQKNLPLRGLLKRERLEGRVPVVAQRDGDCVIRRRGAEPADSWLPRIVEPKDFAYLAPGLIDNVQTFRTSERKFCKEKFAI